MWDVQHDLPRSVPGDLCARGDLAECLGGLAGQLEPARVGSARLPVILRLLGVEQPLVEPVLLVLAAFALRGRVKR
ncbi:hypothetical protein B1H19_02295 [Streptomyces gilvosporeus]|uniref:Uncharacterized protein n=1 Tax=Streptomyces gilvosporeus TaxID=553510 RepID=A0A1V0TJT9_9ACTN|nr:hypothetical protein B1H19_02295 [Streptomyces gilvosporeus]